MNVFQNLLRKKGLEQRNANFQNLTPAQKRVAIAQDVINQIQLNKIIPDGGGYISISDDGDCHVCALGACFISAQRLSLNISKPTTVANRFGFNREILGEYFSAIQMDLMESAYELTEMVYSDDLEDEAPIVQAAIRFGESHDRNEEIDGESRMIAIMQNIIDNGGCFIPVKKTKNGYASCAC